MVNVTLSDAIKRTQGELRDAKARVAELEHRLSTLQSVFDELQPEKPGRTSSLGEPTVSSGETKPNCPKPENIGRKGSDRNLTDLSAAIVDAIESASGEFSASTIAENLAERFPEIPEKKIARRASQYVMKYSKEGKTERVTIGTGKTPHTYKLKK